MLDAETKKLSEQHNFDARGYAFTAEPEECREPRIVRIAAVQHAIVEPTTEKVNIQRDALHAKIGKIIQAAAASNVNIVCLQEAWSQYNCFWIQVIATQHIQSFSNAVCILYPRKATMV